MSSDDYKAILAENQRLKEQVTALEGQARSLASDLFAARNRNADLEHAINKAAKTKLRALDPKAASAFDRPWNGR